MPRRRAPSSTKRRSPSPNVWTSRRSARATAAARMSRRRDGEDAVVLHAGGRPQPPRRVARQGAQRSRAATARCCAAARRCCRPRTRLCATAWMHGVFGAQLTIGNTTFHKLFSVSRDPYNIVRGNGLRILVDLGDGWRLLAVPSAFEMGLCDCRWIYRLGQPDDHRLGARLEPGARAAMARRRRRRQMPFPRLRPSRPRRA